MVLSFLVHVHPEPGGGWHVAAGQPGATQAVGRLQPAEVQAIRAEVAAALDPEAGPTVLFAGDDAWQTAAEARAGRALARVLHASADLTRLFTHALGQAQGREATLAVLVAAAPGARDLPWELLSAWPEGPPLEGAGEGWILRLEEGKGPRPGVAALRPMWWGPDGEDPAVVRLVGAVGEACRAAGLPTPLPAADSRLQPYEEALLFVVAHGQADEHALHLLVGPDRVDAGATVHVLLENVARAALVVLLVCDGRHCPERPAEALVGQLLRAGARACVASDVRLGVDTAEAFVAGLCRALGAQAPLGAAMAAGRRAVRARLVPFAEARWWRLGLTAGHADAAAWRPREGLPVGWRPGPDAAALLFAALDLARVLDNGWLGVEHLFLMAGSQAAGLPVWARALAEQHQPALRVHLSGFGRVPGPPRPLGPSPRLDRLVQGLAPGFTPMDLLVALLAHLPEALVDRLELRELLYRTVDFTRSEELLPLGAGRADGPWRTLEVLGGPEDGRVLAVQEGDVIGRFDPSRAVAHALFRDSPAEDPAVSRTHLHVAADGHLRLERRIAAVWGAPDAPLGAGALLPLQAGQVVWITRRTALWAVEDPAAG